MDLKTFRKNCEEKKVPIIRFDSEKLIIEKLKELNPKKILELGMAVGYSATIWGTNFDTKIKCVELDEKNIPIASANFAKFGIDDVEIINDDARTFDTNEKFDFIFIDAGKSWYLEYFKRFQKNLNDNGVIIFDNVTYHGLLKTNGRKHRTIIRKMNEFHDYINTENHGYMFKWYDIDDGLLFLSKDEKLI